jgi:oligopeptide/dipeptide ABC transporter ATP-binding protein
MGVIAQLADRVAVMYAGRIVETAAVHALFRAPTHPYSRALMACMPIRNVGLKRLRTIAGQAPRPGSIAAGCAFAARCPDVHDSCWLAFPGRVSVAAGHDVLCTLPAT